MSARSTESEAVRPGHVRLILVPQSSFYLEVPLSVITSLCLKPKKYLIFLGWCILGVEGSLSEAEEGEAMNLNGDLDDEGVYYLVTPDSDAIDLSQAVDLEVIKQRTHSRSGTTNTRHRFRDALLERDFCCVWTGASKNYGEGMHIIPYARGSQWLRLIVENRSGGEEDIEDINDIRNGVFTTIAINSAFDRRALAILKTPNAILERTDIPKPPKRPIDKPKEVTISTKFRYTLQWLEEPDAGALRYVCGHNVDAAFLKATNKSKPSGLLVHYHYGAAAVERWGHGVEVLENHPRPPAPPPVPMAHSPAAGSGAANVAAREASGSGQMLDSEWKDQAQWDADDVVLYLRANSRAATERYRMKQEKSARDMEQWRRGVPSLSI